MPTSTEAAVLGGVAFTFELLVMVFSAIRRGMASGSIVPSKSAEPWTGGNYSVCLTPRTIGARWKARTGSSDICACEAADSKALSTVAKIGSGIRGFTTSGVCGRPRSTSACRICVCRIFAVELIMKPPNFSVERMAGPARFDQSGSSGWASHRALIFG